MNTLGNVALVGGAAVAGVALGGEGLADWLDGNEGQDVNAFWKSAANMVQSAHDGIHNAAEYVLPEGMDKHAGAIAAATAVAVGGGLKFATSHEGHNDVAPCSPNVPNLNNHEQSRN